MSIRKGLFWVLGWSISFAPLAFAEDQTVVLKQEYAKAIEQAHQHHLPSEPLEILRAGSVIEMATWTDFSYQEGSEILAHSVWVVKADEMKRHCSEILASTNPSLRVDQYLGMPPETPTSQHFVLMKVPVDRYLFQPVRSAEGKVQAFKLRGEVVRPCFSSGDVSVGSCHYLTGEEQKKQPLLSPYASWISSIEAETKDYPWTGLGYTFDWAPQSRTHVGLSEFILPVGSNVEVEKSESVRAFCA